MSDVQIAGFEMMEKLGTGGWATVWKARQISLDRIVAIKILSQRLAQDPADVQRFQAEAQAAARLKHPGIVQVYDAGIEQGCYFLVMEYVAGYTVGDWVRRKKVLGEEDALLVADCVADALSYAWTTARIIHCDIKPDNVIIDADGTVKVTDLGLARTINAVSNRASEDEVMGTPAFMSPEQVRGDPNLDYHTDMYSVGAMIYHLVTGKLLFQGFPDDKIMEMQVTDTVPDAVEANAALGPGICWLIEKMLAKKPEARHTDWNTVRADFARVRKGAPPQEILQEGMLSTVRRSALRKPHDAPALAVSRAAVAPVPASVAARTAATGPGRFLAILGIALLCVATIGGWALLLRERRTQEQLVQAAPANDAEFAKERRARDMFEQAAQFAQQHPDLFNEAQTNFRQVAEQYGGTKYEIMARERIVALTVAKRAAVDEVIRKLDQSAAPLVAKQDFAEAAKLYETYTGPLEEDTREARAAKAKEHRDRLAEIATAETERKAKLETEFGSFMDEVAAAIVSGGIDAGRDLVITNVDAPKFELRRDDLVALRRLLTDAAKCDERIMDSFVAQQGQEVALRMSSGKRRNLVIDYVKEGKVYAKVPNDAAMIRVNFVLDDLSLTERLQRMGPDDKPDAALMKGYAALKAGAYTQAVKSFASTTPLLSDRLSAYASTEGDKKLDANAEAALCHVMALMGIAVDKYDAEGWLKEITASRMPSETGEVVRKDLRAFQSRYGRTGFAQKADPVVKAMADAIARATAPKPVVKLTSPATGHEKRVRPRDDERTNGGKDKPPAANGKPVGRKDGGFADEVDKPAPDAGALGSGAI